MLFALVDSSDAVSSPLCASMGLSGSMELLRGSVDVSSPCHLELIYIVDSWNFLFNLCLYQLKLQSVSDFYVIY